jgi:molybdopterin synthase catalytic subunit
MADKYASKQQQNREEAAADIMQARMSWPEAERYAAEFARRGVLESGDQILAVAVLAEHMTRNRATAIVKDLVDYGAMEAKQ